jgi:hypothetical protein
MLKKILFIIIVANSLFTFSQLKEEKEGYYLEDQIYLKISYNLLDKLPKNISQSGFSNSFSLGFIRDFPINKQRNFGFGLGVGYGFETYFHNLKITDINNTTQFEYFNENFDSNKLKINQLEVPFEVRWRTSTVEKYKFWRIYSGIKVNYIFISKSVFNINEKQVYKNINALNKIQYGLTVAAGYGTFNFFIYYGLSPLFKDANLNGEKIEIKEIKFGLQFYIL